MRAADKAEVHAAGHSDLQAVVALGVRRSVLCWAVTVDGALACIVGVAPLGRTLLADTGVPWLLGTDVLAKNKRPLMRLAPPYIDQMLRAYPRLVNFVHADNVSAVSWLGRLKFEVAPAAPYGPHGALFHRFEMRRNV